MALFVFGAFALLSLLDIPLLHIFYHKPLQHIEYHDWYRLLRIIGYMGTWIIVGLVYIAHDRNRHRGLAIFLSALISGILAELLKLIVARDRPVINGDIQPGWYHFNGLFSGFLNAHEHGQGQGFPSSHAAVAFGGCIMLSCFLPKAQRLLLMLAIGCGITRMLTGAHFATDVFGGALLGWGSARMMCYFAGAHIEGLRPKYRMPF